ncbi:MAG: DUF1574 family protein [Candidatus Omnitrophica bacterium]|nr:DUF1574 family protein [Candidatus Omnitrophota bacterium]
MKKFCFKILILVLPVLLGVAAVNLWVDPAKLFSKDYTEAAQILLKGSNLLLFSNIDERLMQQSYITNLTRPKDVVILGSSRSMGLGKELFPGKNIFNSSVSSATLTDLLAIFYLYYEKSIVPKTMVLSLDPWIFNGQRHDRSYDFIKKAYPQMLARMGHVASLKKEWGREVFERYQELFSFSYFQESLVILIKNQFKPPRTFFKATPQTNDDKFYVISNDGSLTYHNKAPIQTPQRMQKLIDQQKETREELCSLTGFEAIDPEAVSILEDFLSFIQGLSSQTIIYLPPYHPFAYNTIMTESPKALVIKAENIIRNMAQRKGIKVYGSYNPERLGLDKDCFYDAIHLKRPCYKESFREAIERH